MNQIYIALNTKNSQEVNLINCTKINIYKTYSNYILKRTYLYIIVTFLDTLKN